MVVAFAALIVALGGTAYAAVKLPARSVGTKELKRNAVGRTQIKNNAVDSRKVRDSSVAGADIADNTVTGQDVNEATLGAVPSAAGAARATTSGALDRVVYRAAPGTVPPAVSDTEPTRAAGTATCDAGMLAVGGGVRVEDVDFMAVDDSYPDGGGRSWTVHVNNDDPAAAHTFSTFVVCVPAGSPG
jgi:hypothetical protein